MKQFFGQSFLWAGLFTTLVVKAQEILVNNQSDRPYNIRINFADKSELFTLEAKGDAGDQKTIMIPAQSLRSFIAYDTRPRCPQSNEIKETQLNHKDKNFHAFMILTSEDRITIAHAYTDSKVIGPTPVEKYICYNREH